VASRRSCCRAKNAGFGCRFKNYRAILGGAFWQNLGNSALIAIVVTGLAVGLPGISSPSSPFCAPSAWAN
jgi:ABC-type glycerol-3-phosphate transport system permease component